MVKNTKGGNKAKKLKNRVIERNLVTKDDVVGGAMYGLIIGNLGNGRCNLTIINDKGIFKENVQGCIRGNVRRCKFEKDDLVLCGLREFNKKNEINEVDIIHKYTLDQKNELLSMGEIIILNSSSLIDNVEFVKGDNFIYDENSEDNDISKNDEDSNEEDRNSNEENDVDITKKNQFDEEIEIKEKQKKLNKITDKKSKEMIKIMRDIQLGNYSCDNIDLDSI